MQLKLFKHILLTILILVVSAKQFCLAKPKISMNFESGIVYSRVSLTEASFSVVSKSGSNTNFLVLLWFGKTWAPYLGYEITQHNYIPPSTRTMLSTQAGTSGIKLGAKGIFAKDIELFFHIDQQTAYCLTNTDTTEHELLTASIMSSTLGFSLLAASRIGYRLGLETAFSIPMAQATLNDLTLKYQYKVSAKVKMDFGRQTLIGFYGGVTMEEYLLGTESYKPSNVIAGIHFAF